MGDKHLFLNNMLRIILVELLSCNLLLGTFALVGSIDLRVFWSTLSSGGILTAYYFFVAIAVYAASDKAKNGRTEQATKTLCKSAAVRMLCLGIVICFLIWLGADVVALTLPLILFRPTLMLCGRIMNYERN